MEEGRRRRRDGGGGREQSLSNPRMGGECTSSLLRGEEKEIKGTSIEYVDGLKLQIFIDKPLPEATANEVTNPFARAQSRLQPLLVLCGDSPFAGIWSIYEISTVQASDSVQLTP